MRVADVAENCKNVTEIKNVLLNKNLTTVLVFREQNVTNPFINTN